MKISIIGNQDLPFDSLPIQIMPKLQEAFPNIDFVMEDPNDLDIPVEDEIYFIDTVKGLKKPRMITIDEIKATQARATAHDFDLSIHLLLVKKIKPEIEIGIIGIPMGYNATDTLREIKVVIKDLMEKI